MVNMVALDTWNRRKICRPFFWGRSPTLSGTIMDVENRCLQEFRLQAGRFPFISFHFISISVMEIVGGIFQDFTRTTYSSFLLWNCVQDTSFPHVPAESSALHPSNFPPGSRKSAWKQHPPSPLILGIRSIGWSWFDKWQTIMSWGGQFFGTQRWRKHGTLEHPLDHLYNIRRLPSTKPPAVWILVAVVWLLYHSLRCHPLRTATLARHREGRIPMLHAHSSKT